jgi:hypothetical protein
MSAPGRRSAALTLLVAVAAGVLIFGACSDDGKQITGCSDNDVPLYNIANIDAGTKAKLHALAQQHNCLTEIGKPP